MSSPLSINQFSKENLVYIHGINEKIATNYIGAIDNTPRYDDATFDYRKYLTKTLNPKSTLDQSIFSVETLYKSNIDAILTDTFKLSVLYDQNRSIEGVYSDLEAVRAMNAIGTFDLSTCFYTTPYTKQLPYVSTFDNDSFIEKIDNISIFKEASENKDLFKEVLVDFDTNNEAVVKDVFGLPIIRGKNFSTIFKYYFKNSQSFITTIEIKMDSDQIGYFSYYFEDEKNASLINMNVFDDDGLEESRTDNVIFKKIFEKIDLETNETKYYAIVNVNGRDIVASNQRDLRNCDNFAYWDQLKSEENVYIRDYLAKDFKIFKDDNDYKAVSLKNINVYNKFHFDDIHFAVYREVSGTNPTKCYETDNAYNIMYSKDNKTWYKCDFDPKTVNINNFLVRFVKSPRAINIVKIGNDYYLCTQNNGKIINESPTIEKTELYKFDMESKRWNSVLKTNKFIMNLKVFNNKIYALGRIHYNESRYDSSINNMKTVSVYKNSLFDITNSKEYELASDIEDKYVGNFIINNDKLYYVLYNCDEFDGYEINGATLTEEDGILQFSDEMVISDVGRYHVLDDKIYYIKKDDDHKLYNTGDDTILSFENETFKCISSIKHNGNNHLIVATIEDNATVDKLLRIYYLNSSNELELIDSNIYDREDTYYYEQQMCCFPYYIGKTFDKFVIKYENKVDTYYTICSFKYGDDTKINIADQTYIANSSATSTFDDPVFWYKSDATASIIGVDYYYGAANSIIINEETRKLNYEHIEVFTNLDLYESKLYWRGQIYDFNEKESFEEIVPKEIVCVVDEYICTKNGIYALNYDENKLFYLCNNPFNDKFFKFKKNGVWYVGSYYQNRMNMVVIELHYMLYDMFCKLVEEEGIGNPDYKFDSSYLSVETILSVESDSDKRYLSQSLSFEYYEKSNMIKLSVIEEENSVLTYVEYFSSDGFNFVKNDKCALSFNNDLTEFKDSLVCINHSQLSEDSNKSNHYLERLYFDKEDPLITTKLIIKKYDLYMIAGKFIEDFESSVYTSYLYKINTLDVINDSIYVTFVKYDYDNPSNICSLYILKIDDLDDESSYSITQVDNVKKEGSENGAYLLIEDDNYIVVNDDEIVVRDNFYSYKYATICGINQEKKEKFSSEIKDYLKYYFFNKLVDKQYLEIINKIVSDFDSISNSYLTFYDMVTKFGITSDKTSAKSMVMLYNDIVEMQKFISFVLSSHQFIEESFNKIENLKKKYPNYMNKYFNSELINQIPHMYNILWSIVDTRLSKLTSIKENNELYNYFSKSLIDTNINDIMKYDAFLGRYLVNPITESSITGNVDESENNLDKIYSVMTQNYDKVKVLVAKYWKEDRERGNDEDKAKIQNVKFLMYLYISVIVLMIFNVISTYSSKNNPLGTIDFDTVMKVLKIDYKKTYTDEEILSDQFDKLCELAQKDIDESNELFDELKEDDRVYDC